MLDVPRTKQCMNQPDEMSVLPSFEASVPPDLHQLPDRVKAREEVYRPRKAHGLDSAQLSEEARKIEEEPEKRARRERTDQEDQRDGEEKNEELPRPPEDLSMFQRGLQLITADMNVQAACYIVIFSVKGESKKMEGNSKIQHTSTSRSEARKLERWNMRPEMAGKRWPTEGIDPVIRMQNMVES